MSTAPKHESTKPLAVTCRSCGHVHSFKQPYPYHAGFGDQGFLYNDAGDLTLVWSTYDLTYSKIVGPSNPWTLSPEKKKIFEDWLPPAPRGGRWRFENPARCLNCKAEISAPIGSNIYYLVYEGSIVSDALGNKGISSLKEPTQEKT
jgi:hypothetical protein